MDRGEDEVRVVLQRPAFGEREKDAVVAKGLTASLFRYSTGVGAIRLSNARGNLPYMGQMVWSAGFDGVPRFVTHVGYVGKAHAASEAARIEGHQR